MENENIKNKYILLPIGICTVSGDENNFEISITADNKQYKFSADGDSITEYWKSGMSEMKKYGV